MTSRSHRPCATAVAIEPKATARRWIVALWVVAALAMAASLFLPAASRGASPVSEPNPNEKVAILAGGCFWCTEAVFERMNGVGDVVSGYIGGRVVDPSYQAVCTGRTGHAEAVQIYYDPSVVTYEELLEVFFKTHDPTTLNKQGADEGTQYRSAIFYQDEAEKAKAEAYIQKLDNSRTFNRPVVTSLEPATKFYVAEEYHQDYFANNPDAGYCRAVVASKVKKFDDNFGDKKKATAN